MDKRLEIPFQLDPDHRRCVVGGEPMLFHCHHYNAFLQRSIRDAEYVDSRPFLIGAAAEVAYAQLRRLFADGMLTSEAEKKALAASLYSWAGFGQLQLDGLGEGGGVVTAPTEHYALAYTAKWQGNEEPVGFFCAGWVAGAACAIYDKPLGSYRVEQKRCAAVEKAPPSEFVVEAGEANYSVFESVGMGPLTEHPQTNAIRGNVDYPGILAALSQMEIVGDGTGLIPAFGVYLTRHYANYYNRISFAFERAIQKQFGADGLEIVRPLLVEAGHVCAFNTFGGIMQSQEWKALILPTLKNSEDWIHGTVACANALGWGRWEVESLTPDEAVFAIYDDYESVGYLAMYGQTDHSVSYLAEGGVVGLMNLVYLGDIQSGPELSETFYDRLFRSNEGFSAAVLAARAKGDQATRLKVYRK